MTDLSLINDYFDYIYVLTLKRAQDRHRSIESTLDGVDYHFFYGIDKRALTCEAVIRDGIYDDAAHRRTKRTRRSMNLGEVACALSHRAIYQDILDKGYEKVLILEDDVLPCRENISLFKEVIKELPEEWELVLLGYYGEKPPTARHKLEQKIYYLCHYLYLDNWHKVNKQWIREICLSPYSDHLYTLGKALGAHAYAMTAAAAEKFIHYQTPVILQADRVFNYYKADCGLNAFAVRPKLFSLSDSSYPSYINNE